MRLQDIFYELLSMQEVDGGFEADVRLIPDNVIFKAHFPGFPVTPGAVQVRMATELLSLHEGRECLLESVSRVKFITPLLPVSAGIIAFFLRDLIRRHYALRAGNVAPSEGCAHLDASQPSVVLPP